jgi:hypothetical protein
MSELRLKYVDGSAFHGLLRRPYGEYTSEKLRASCMTGTYAKRPSVGVWCVLLHAASPNQSAENTPEVRKLVGVRKVDSRVKSQYGSEMDGLTACNACSYMRENATCEVTNPGPWCQWSHDLEPP